MTENIRAHQNHLREESSQKGTTVIKTSRYFTLSKSVHRHQSGRGAKFQNHKITSYKIQSNMTVWNSAWSPSDEEVTALINADFVRDGLTSRRIWKFYNKRDVDRAWVLLLLKYGE